MYEENAKDRAIYVLSIFMVFFANFILIPAAVILVVLMVLAILDKEFMLAGVFILSAVLCFIVNRVIIKIDDRYEEQKAKAREEYRQSQIKKIDVRSNVAKSGKLEFEYDGIDDVMKLSGKQLRTFNNDAAFDVISYDTEGVITEEVNILEKIYKDEKDIIEGLRKRLLEYCQQEGANVSESDVRRIKMKELAIENSKRRHSFELMCVYEDSNVKAEVYAVGKYDSNEYEFLVSWG